LTEGVQGGPLPTTIAGLHRAFSSGTLTPAGATASYLRRIDERNPSLNCFITKLTVSAGTSAAEAERRFASGSPLGPLDGVPIAVKDVIYISGVKCTAGSKILANNVATYDSPVVRRLKDAGVVLVGTTNLHEFTAGVTSNNPHFGPVRNPWNLDRVAGGSSGGSAAAVASGMVPAALGTDTAGSVRIPAALCGVLGLKPTYGRVSRLGVIPLAPSFDTVGVLTSSAWDAAAMLQTIAGHDEGDPTTVETPVPNYLSDLTVLSSLSGSASPRTRSRAGSTQTSRSHSIHSSGDSRRLGAVSRHQSWTAGMKLPRTGSRFAGRRPRPST